MTIYEIGIFIFSATSLGVTFTCMVLLGNILDVLKNKPRREGNLAEFEKGDQP